MASAQKQKKNDGFWEIMKTIFWAGLIAIGFRTVLFQPFSIPSGSMKPTLLVGDYLFVSKYSYGYSHFSLPFQPDWFEGRIWASMPERGDVVVFKLPGKDACSQGPIGMAVNIARVLVGARRAPDDCTDYVKRVIGLPGDRIQMIGGILHINGEALKTVRDGDFVEPKVARGSPPRMPSCINRNIPEGGPCHKEHWRETLPGGRVHSILNTTGIVGDVAGAAFPDKTVEFVVPEGHLFFMGDNRDNSLDSRFRDGVGFVPFENLIGRAEVIALSSDGPFWQFWNWRGDRFLKSIE